MNKIIDFYTGDALSEQDAQDIITINQREAICVLTGANDKETTANHAHTLSFAGYKMIHFDDMIELCETVDEVKVVKRIFDALDCELLNN